MFYVHLVQRGLIGHYHIMECDRSLIDEPTIIWARILYSEVSRYGELSCTIPVDNECACSATNAFSGLISPVYRLLLWERMGCTNIYGLLCYAGQGRAPSRTKNFYRQGHHSTVRSTDRPANTPYVLCNDMTVEEVHMELTVW